MTVESSVRRGIWRVTRRGRKGRALGGAWAAALILVLLLGVGGAYAVPDAVIRASGALPKAKTEQTVKAERELGRLTAYEKNLKEQIKAATVNRSKLLAAKRAELKELRKKRDDAIKKDVAAAKSKKEKQAEALSSLKKQLAAVKKTKNKVAIAAMEVSVGLAKAKLDELAAALKKENGRLSQSYQDYKAAYDRLTALDAELKTILDYITPYEAKIKERKADFKETKAEYGSAVKAKDFLTAERRMNSLVFIQDGINDDYYLILDFRLRFKNDYYAQIVNYKP